MGHLLNLLMEELEALMAPTPANGLSIEEAASRTFMALVLWREARGESEECIVAVAHSILNRVQAPGWWGHSLQEVLFKKWQYSSMTDPHDRQLTLWPDPADEKWKLCLTIAHEVCEGKRENPVPGADSYHDISIPDPKWATAETFVKQIDRIRFFNLGKDPTDEKGGTVGGKVG